MVLFLHGAGECRNDNENSSIAYPRFWGTVSTAKAISVSLSFRSAGSRINGGNTPWENGAYNQDGIADSQSLRCVIKRLNHLEHNYSADRNREYVMGVSMSGFGTWDIITRYPERFAAAIPVCGAGDPQKAGPLNKLPIRTFYGNADKTVPVSGTRAMADAIQEAGGNVLYREYDDTDHACWIKVWKEPGLIDWMFEQKKGDYYIVYEGYYVNL